MNFKIKENKRLFISALNYVFTNLMLIKKGVKATVISNYGHIQKERPRIHF